MAPALPPSDPATEAARTRRNLVIAGALLAFVVLVFIITMVRLQGGIPDRM